MPRIRSAMALLLAASAFATSCTNSKEVLDNLSTAVESYCACIDTALETPSAILEKPALLQLEKPALLQLEKKECGEALEQIAVAQKEITVPGDEAIRTIRSRQQECYYKFRDAHSVKTPAVK